MPTRSFTGPLLLLHTTLIGCTVSCGTEARVHAQDSGRRFEVVSVKENTSGELGGYASMDLTASEFQPRVPISGPVTIRNIALCNLIARAYEVSGALQRYGLFNGLAGGGS